MRDHLPKLFLALLAGAILLAGAWGYASYDLDSRLAQFQRATGTMSYARGGHLAGEAAARAHISESAQEANVDVSDIEVEIRDEAGLDAAGAVLNRHAAVSGAPQVRMSMRRYHFTCRVSAHKWLWSLDRALDFTVSKRGRVEFVLPPRRY